ncbi:MAG: glutathione synthase [Proteobacteria bacterium]|nr:MAG: glutathione synthase [Pseudomonadota bacterium]
MRIGVVMDSIKNINIKKDSTFAMLLAAQARGWQIEYMETQDLFLQQGEPCADMATVKVFDQPEKWFDMEQPRTVALEELDAILMRKDPPVDSEYIFATHILELAEKEGVLIVNKPQSLRDYNEKLFATHFPQCCPPVLVTRKADKIREFFDANRDIILKPLDSMGGTGIFRVKQGDSNFGVICEILTDNGNCQIMAQKFIPDIKDGDKRILIIDGKPVPWGLARIPMKGENRGNLAAGGTGVARELTDRDRWICDQIAPTLIEKGLLFVGIDVIGDYLTEINVTSPTCIRELDKTCNLDIAGSLMDAITARVGSGC